MTALLCIAIYLGPTDTRPIVEVCSYVEPSVSAGMLAECNRDTDHCEWIVAPEDRIEWTIFPRGEE